MKKKQLLQAMKSLPMLEKDKEKFVNIIIESKSNEGGINNSKYRPRYFKIDWDKANSDWHAVVYYYDKHNISYYDKNITSTLKLELGSNIFVIIPFATMYKSGMGSDVIRAFSFIPNCIGSLQLEEINNVKVRDFEETIAILSENLNLSMDGITEITEEEYYNLN